MFKMLSVVAIQLSQPCQNCHVKLEMLRSISLDLSFPPHTWQFYVHWKVCINLHVAIVGEGFVLAV